MQDKDNSNKKHFYNTNLIKIDKYNNWNYIFRMRLIRLENNRMRDWLRQYN